MSDSRRLRPRQLPDQPRERRSKRGRREKECNLREEQEKMDQLAAAMAQLAQAQQQMLQQIAPQRTRIEMAIYQEGEDIESFLETFEGMMRLHQVPRDEWVVHLIPKLQGRARDACGGLTYTETYAEVKEVLRKRFNVTEEGSRQSLRNLKFNSKMTHEEYAIQAMKLTSRWLTPDKGEEQMRQKVAMEQMVQGMNEGMKKWIVREQPPDPYAMAELMQVYLVSEKTRENSTINRAESHGIQRSGSATWSRV